MHQANSKDHVNGSREHLNGSGMCETCVQDRFGKVIKKQFKCAMTKHSNHNKDPWDLMKKRDNSSLKSN